MGGEPDLARSRTLLTRFPDHLGRFTARRHSKRDASQAKSSEVVEEVFDGPHATPPNAEEGPCLSLGSKNLTGTLLISAK